MEDKKLVRIGVALRASEGAAQHSGLSSRSSFNFPVTKSERVFLDRLAKAITMHALPRQGAALIVQDLD
jgi:hypothetical protein